MKIDYNEIIQHSKSINTMNKVAAIQMNSSMDIQENLATAKKLLKQAAEAGVGLAVLPEMFALFGKTPMENVYIAETFGHGMIQDFLSEQAVRNKMWIVGGTIPLKCDNPYKMRAACLVFNDKGERVARYDKMHLFDVHLSQSESYEESATTEPGTELGILDTPFGRLGLAVCYDVRFADLFRELFLKGAEILAIPCAFAVKTGQAHFEVLMRARAIENFSYVIAAGQAGLHQNGRKTYGNSIIVSPWGDVAQSLGDREGTIVTDINLDKLHQIRESIPTYKQMKSFI